MSYYSDKRRKAGLSKSEVAEKLGIDYAKYELIDRGILRMPNRFLDKFNQIVNKSKNETVIDKLDKIDVVNKWWDEMSIKKAHGSYALNDKMKEFNIETLGELDKLLGYSSKGATSGYLCNSKVAGFDFKNKLYNFFHDELNIQPPKTNNNIINKEKNRSRHTPEEQKEYRVLLDWYNTVDLHAWKDKHNFTKLDICHNSGLSEGSVHNLMNRKGSFTPILETLRRLKEYYDKTEEQPVVMTFTSVPTNEVPEEIRRRGEELVREVNENMTLKETLSSKYREKIDNIEQRIKAYKELIGELEKEKEIYETVLEDLED